jgi:hypothetical protein
LNYQIKTFSGVLWIIPSGAPDPSSAASVKLVIPYFAGTGLKPNTPAQDIDGTISLKWLPASSPTGAEITVPAEILFDADRDKLFSAWQQFLVNLDVQVSKHYMLPQAPALIRALLLQHMPLPQPEVKCYQLGFGYKDARYINLQAGMRLKLAFSNFYNEDSSGPGEKLKRFAGTGVSYAYVQAANNGDYLTFNSFMDLQQVNVAPQTSAPKIHVLASVLDLAAQTQNKYYRLYYPQEFTAVDKPEISIAHNVCLVGASNYNELPELPVDTATNYSIGIFNGRCSVTPEILIKLNGKPVYVAVGATLSSLLERESVSGIVAGQLTMLRYLDGQKSRITFDEPKTVATAMYLLPGDDISWVASGNFALIERVRAIYRITKPSPIALNLANLTVESFGTGEQVVLPMANDMGVALYESHQAPYTSAEIGQALYPVYNHAPFTPPYSGEELAYSLYFAGFDVVDVSKGVIAGVDTPQITIADGYLLVQFLLKSGIGYTIVDIGKGVHYTLNNADRANARYLVKALIIASHNQKDVFASLAIANAVYTVIDYQIPAAVELAAELMIGSDIAQLPGRYPSTDVAKMLYVSYQDKTALTKLQLADALALACKGQAQAYGVKEVAAGIAAVYDDIIPVDMARALRACAAGYDMNNVALGTYHVAYGPKDNKQQISVDTLVDALFDTYQDQPGGLNIAIAKAVVYAVANLDINVLADALKTKFNYEVTNPDHYLALSQALAAAYNFTAESQDELNRLAAALTHALQLNKASQDQGKYLSKSLILINGLAVEMLKNGQAIRQALGYIGDDQADVTMVIADWQYAYNLNRDLQADVNKLAGTVTYMFGYIFNKRSDLILLAKGIKDALEYSADSFDQALLTANAIQGAMKNISMDDLTWAICEVFNCKTTPQVEAKVCLLAKVIAKVYNLQRDNRENVADLARKMATVFGFIPASGLFSFPVIKDYDQPSISNIAAALVYAFDFNGDDSNHVSMTAFGVVSAFPALPSVMTATALAHAFNYQRGYGNQNAVSFMARAIKVAYNWGGEFEDVKTMVSTIFNVFDTNPESKTYRLGDIKVVVNAVKYGFGFTNGDLPGAAYIITGLVKVYANIDYSMPLDAVINVFSIAINTTGDNISYGDRAAFDFMLKGIVWVSDSPNADETLINAAKFGARYFNLGENSLAGAKLVVHFCGEMCESYTKDFQKCLRGARLFGLSYPGIQKAESWLYNNVGFAASALNYEYAGMGFEFLLEALKVALPRVLPAYVGKTLVSMFNLNINQIATAIINSYGIDSYSRFEIELLSVLLDHFGWKANAYDEKIAWFKTKFGSNWLDHYGEKVKWASENDVAQMGSHLVIANTPPVDTSRAINDALRPHTSGFPMDFIDSMYFAIYSNYHLVLPAEPVNGIYILTRMSKIAGVPELLLVPAFKRNYRGLWKDEYAEIVKIAYREELAEPTQECTQEDLDKLADTLFL